MTIENRLQTLQPNTQRMLVAASPVGRSFDFDLLDALGDLDEDDLVDAIDEAERARLIASTIDAGGVRFSFAHELVRQTLLSQVSHTRRQRLHLRIADALEHVHRASLSESAAAIAYHLGEAGPFADPERTSRFLTMAGERALEAAAFEEAVHHLRLVLSMVKDDDLETRAPLLDLVARAERSLGHLDEALALWNEAIDGYEIVGDVVSAARVCLDAAIQVAWWRRGRDATRLVDHGLETLGDADTSTRAGLLAVAGMTASQTGTYDGAEGLLTEALSLATQQGDDRIIGLTLYARATHHFSYAEYGPAVEVGLESIGYLRRAGDLWNLANIQGYVGASLGWLGRFDEAAELGSEGEALAYRLGNWSAFVFAEQARVFREIGLHPVNSTLEQRGRDALELGREIGYSWMTSVGHARVGLSAFWQGRWPEALAEFERSAEAATTGAVGGQDARLPLIHAYLGNRAVARELLDRARPLFPSVGGPATARSWAMATIAVEAYRLLGEPDEVAALAPTISDCAATTGGIMRAWDFRLIATLQGIAAGCRGEWDEAESHFEHALRLSQQLPMRREEPEARRFYAQMLLDRGRTGDRDRARALLEVATEGYTSFEMPAHAALARGLLD